MTARKLAEKALRALAKEDLLYQHHGNVCARDEAYDRLAEFFEEWRAGSSQTSSKGKK